MAQGSFKKQASRPGKVVKSNSAKAAKAIKKAKMAKKGAPVQLPKNIHREAAIEDRELSKVRVYLCSADMDNRF
jgi:hypothetical protein